MYLRYSVHQMRPATAPEIPILQHILQPPFTSGKHTLTIHRNTNNIQSTGLDRLNGVHIRPFFTQYTFPLLNPVPVGVPDIRERLDCLVEAVGSSTGH